MKYSTTIIGLIIACSIMACDVELPEATDAVIDSILPGCRVTVCDEECNRCITRDPPTDNFNCDVAVCGELHVTPGAPGDCQLITLSEEQE